MTTMAGAPAPTTWQAPTSIPTAPSGGNGADKNTMRMAFDAASSFLKTPFVNVR